MRKKWRAEKRRDRQVIGYLSDQAELGGFDRVRGKEDPYICSLVTSTSIEKRNHELASSKWAFFWCDFLNSQFLLFSLK